MFDPDAIYYYYDTTEMAYLRYDSLIHAEDWDEEGKLKADVVIFTKSYNSRLTSYVHLERKGYIFNGWSLYRNDNYKTYDHTDSAYTNMQPNYIPESNEEGAEMVKTQTLYLDYENSRNFADATSCATNNAFLYYFIEDNNFTAEVLGDEEHDEEHTIVLYANWTARIYQVNIFDNDEYTRNLHIEEFDRADVINSTSKTGGGENYIDNTNFYVNNSYKLYVTFDTNDWFLVGSVGEEYQDDENNVFTRQRQAIIVDKSMSNWFYEDFFSVTEKETSIIVSDKDSVFELFGRKKIGYTWLGWSTTQDMVMNNGTISSQVYFDTNLQSSAEKTFKALTAENLSLSADPEDTVELLNQYFTEEQKYGYDVTSNQFISTGTINLYACWQQNKYNISIDPRDSTSREEWKLGTTEAVVGNIGQYTHDNITAPYYWIQNSVTDGDVTVPKYRATIYFDSNEYYIEQYNPDLDKYEKLMYDYNKDGDISNDYDYELVASQSYYIPLFEYFTYDSESGGYMEYTPVSADLDSFGRFNVGVTLYTRTLRQYNLYYFLTDRYGYTWDGYYFDLETTLDNRIIGGHTVNDFAEGSIHQPVTNEDLIRFNMHYYNVAKTYNENIEDDREMFIFTGWKANEYFINYDLNDSEHYINMQTGSSEAEIITSNHTNYLTFDKTDTELAAENQLEYYKVLAERIGYTFIGWNTTILMMSENEYEPYALFEYKDYLTRNTNPNYYLYLNKDTMRNNDDGVLTLYRNYIDLSGTYYDDPETPEIDERYVCYIDDATCYDKPFYIEQYGDLEDSREIVLIAVWLKNTYNIIFELNDVSVNNGSTEAGLVDPSGTVTPNINSINIKFDESDYYLTKEDYYISNIVVDRYGYTFLGWSFNVTTSKEVYYLVEEGTRRETTTTYYHYDDNLKGYVPHPYNQDEWDDNDELRENVRIYTKSNTIYEAKYAYERLADPPYMPFYIDNYIEKYIDESDEHHMTIRLFATWKANEYRFNYDYNAPVLSDLVYNSYAGWNTTSQMTTNADYPNLAQIVGSSPSSEISGTYRIIFDEELKSNNVSREGYTFIGYALGTDLNNCAIFTKNLYEDKTTIRLNNDTAIVNGTVYLYNTINSLGTPNFVEKLGLEDCDDYYINLYALWQPIVYSVIIEANTEDGSTHAYFYDNTDENENNHQFITNNVNDVIDLSVQFDTDDWVYTYNAFVNPDNPDDPNNELYRLRELIIGRLGYTWRNFYLTSSCSEGQNVLTIEDDDNGNITKTENVFNYVMFEILKAAGNVNSELKTLSIFNGWLKNTYDVIIDNNEIGDETSLARFSDSSYSEEFNTNSIPITVTFDTTEWINMLDDSSAHRMDRYGYTWNYLWPQTGTGYGSHIKNGVTTFDYTLFKYLFNSENLDDECSMLNTYGDRTEITVYAHWIANEYKIHIVYNDLRDLNGSSTAKTLSGSETIAGDQTIVRKFGEELNLEVLTRLGYNFKGWIVGDSAGEFLQYSTEAMEEGGITFEDYLISEYDNILNYTYLKSIRETFPGLFGMQLPVYHSTSGNETQEALGDAENRTAFDHRVIHIYAYYTKKIYTIVFNANDLSSTGNGTTYAWHKLVTGSGSDAYQQGVPQGTANSIFKIKFDTADWQNLDKLYVSRYGYVFNGWYAVPLSNSIEAEKSKIFTDTTETANDLRLVNRTSTNTTEGEIWIKQILFTESVYLSLKSSGVTDNDIAQIITLYAGWTPRVYEVEYITGYNPANQNTDAENAFESQDQTTDGTLTNITFDTEVVLPTLEKTGFDFVGWSFDSVSYYSSIENPLGYFSGLLAIVTYFDGTVTLPKDSFKVKFGNYLFRDNATTNIVNSLVNNTDKSLLTYNGNFYLYEESCGVSEDDRVLETLGSESNTGGVYLYAVWKPRTFSIVLEFNDVTDGFGSTEAILTNGNWISNEGRYESSYVYDSTLSHVFEKNYEGVVEYNQKYEVYSYLDENGKKVYAFEFLITLYTPFNDLSYDKNVHTNFLIDRYGYTWTGWHLKSSVDKNTHLVNHYNPVTFAAGKPVTELNPSIDYYSFDGTTYTPYDYLAHLEDFETVDGKLQFKNNLTLYTPFISPRQETNVILTIDHIERYEQFMADNGMADDDDILRLVAGWNVNNYNISYVNNAIGGSSTVYQVKSSTSDPENGVYDRLTTEQTTLTFDETTDFFFYRIGYDYHGYSFVNYTKHGNEHNSYFEYVYDEDAEEGNKVSIATDNKGEQIKTVWYMANNKTLTLCRDYVVSRETSNVYLYTGATLDTDLGADVPFEVLGDAETEHHIVIYVFWQVQEFEFNIALNTQNLYNFDSDDAGYKLQFGELYNMSKNAVEAYAEKNNDKKIITFKMNFDTKFKESAVSKTLLESGQWLNEVVLYATGYDFTSLGVAPEDGVTNTLVYTYNKNDLGVTNETLVLNSSLFDLLNRFDYTGGIASNRKLSDNITISTSQIIINDMNFSSKKFHLYAYYTIKKYTIEVNNYLANSSDPKNGVYKLFNYISATGSMMANASQGNLPFYTTEYIAVLPVSSGHYLSKLTMQLTGDDGIKKYLILEIAYDQTIEEKVLRFMIYRYGEDPSNLDNADTLDGSIYNKIKQGGYYNRLTQYYYYDTNANMHLPYTYNASDWIVDDNNSNILTLRNDGITRTVNGSQVTFELFERANVLTIPDNESATGSTELFKYLFNQLSITTIDESQNQVDSGKQFFSICPEDETGIVNSVATNVVYPSTYPNNVLFSYLKFTNIKSNIQIYCEYNIQKFDVEIQNEIIIDGLVDNSIPNEEPKEYKYGTLITEITSEHEEKISTANGALELKGWYYKYSDDGEEYELTDDTMILERDIILVCKYEKSSGKPTRKIMFYVWDRTLNKYVVYDTGTEYVFQGIVNKYDVSNGSVSTDYEGFTYMVVPADNSVTLWYWTDYDKIPFFEFKINDSTEYWIPSTEIQEAYGNNEFKGLISKIENGVVKWYYCSQKPTEDNYLSIIQNSSNYITETVLTYVPVESGVKYIDTTVYYTFNGSTYAPYTYNANDWTGFVKDSITLYTVTSPLTVTAGATYNKNYKYYTKDGNVYVHYTYNPSDWAGGTLRSGLTLYILSETNGTLVTAGAKYNSSTIYYTYKNGVYAKYNYRAKDWSGLLTTSKLYVSSGNDVLYVRPTNVPSIGEAYPGSQIIGFGVFDPALSAFKLLANIYKGYLYATDSSVYGKYQTEFTTYYNKLESDYSYYVDIFNTAVNTIVDETTGERFADVYLILEKYTIAQLIQENAYINVYNLSVDESANKTYIDIEFITADDCTSILNGVKLRNVELVSTSTDVNECLYALQAYAAFSFTISDYSKINHFSLDDGTVVINKNYLDTISYYEIVGGTVDYYQKSEVRTVVLTSEQFNTYSNMIADGTPPATALQEIIKKYKLSPKKSFWDDGSIVYADVDLDDDSYMFMFFYKNGSTSTIITTCDTYVYRNGNRLEYYSLTNNFSFRLNSITVRDTSLPNTAQVTLIKNNMNTSYVSGSYVLDGDVVGGEKYLTSNIFFVQLNSSQIKTLIAADDKETTLQEMFTTNGWVVRNSNTTFACEGMGFIVAYFADINGVIQKVAANYASIDANGETPTRSIIYMQELMFTANTEVNLSDTTLNYSDINADTMLTDVYDFNYGVSLSPATHTLEYVVFNGSTFKVIADLVMNELYTWTNALKFKKMSGTSLRPNGSVDVSSGVYYVVPLYTYTLNINSVNTTISYFGANFIKIVNGTSFSVETLSNDIAFTITSIESEVVGSNIQLEFNRDYINDVYFDYELNALNEIPMEIAALTNDEFDKLMEYYSVLKLINTSSIIVSYGGQNLKLKQFTFEQTLQFILYYYRIEQKILNSTNPDDIQANQTVLDFLKMAMFEAIPNGAEKEGSYFILTGDMFDEAVAAATINKITTSDIYSIPISHEDDKLSGVYIGIKLNINGKNIDKVSMNYVEYTHDKNANFVDTTIKKTYANFVV